MNGHANGHANGIVRTTSTSSTSSEELTIVSKTWHACQRKVLIELDDVDEAYLSSVNIESFLEWMNSQRIIDLPRAGSKWDKVLRSAEYFALQLSAYQELVHAHDSERALNLALANCRLLLEVGSIFANPQVNADPT